MARAERVRVGRESSNAARTKNIQDESGRAVDGHPRAANSPQQDRRRHYNEDRESHGRTRHQQRDQGPRFG